MELWFLLADASVGVADLAPAISTLGSLGISGWFVIHVMTKTLPKNAEDRRAELEQANLRHDTQLKEQRTDLLGAIGEQRKDFLQDLAAQRADFLADLKELRQSRGA